MRKKLSLLLAILLLIRLFCLAAAADDHSHPGDATHTFDKEQDVPFYVEQVEHISRYAVDVEYKSMTIQVESAIWDVNEYHYIVTMEDMADTGVFETSLTVINHSDLPVDAYVDMSLDTGLALNANSVVGKKTLRGVKHQEINAVSESFPIYIAATNGWQSYINTVIARGVPDDYICPVGTVTLTVSRVDN